MTRLDGAGVLLTGASRGLGRVLAIQLARRGARLGLVARGADALEEVASAVRAEGAQAFVLPCDLGDRVEVGALPAQARRALGEVDILVHNAGIEPFTPFEEADAVTLHQVLAVNLEAPMQLTRALLPDMLARGRGHVLFMGSTSGLFAAPYAATYGATKAAVATLSRSLAIEYADRGISFSVIEPGFVVGTGMFEHARGDRELEPPMWLGSTTAERVARATIDALVHGRPEVIVNSMPYTPLVTLARAAPGLGLSVAGRLVAPFMARLARGEP